MVKIVKILIVIILAFIIFSLLTPDGYFGSRFKLYRLLLTSSLEEIRNDYANQPCDSFSETEKKEGQFEAFVTGYCKPQAADFESRNDFLCSVALNCSCPNGKIEEKNCHSSSFRWQGCKDFNNQQVDYCHQTASTVKPEAGHVAADWKCFDMNSQVEIDKKIYTITDRGGLIKGRRFDIWFDDCSEAEKTTSIYKVKINE